MIGLRICLATMLLTAFYIFTSVQISCLIFNNKANGSLIKRNSKIIGSRLIGQNFTNLKYFHSRPSSNNYKNDISGNSNFPYHSKELKKFISIQNNNYLKINEKIAPDLNSISESASGLDPHITMKNAINQAYRISKNTNIDEREIINLINKKSKRSGFSANQIVNVLELNIELERMYAQKTRT